MDIFDKLRAYWASDDRTHNGEVIWTWARPAERLGQAYPSPDAELAAGYAAVCFTDGRTILQAC